MRQLRAIQVWRRDRRRAATVLTFLLMGGSGAASESSAPLVPELGAGLAVVADPAPPVTAPAVGAVVALSCLPIDSVRLTGVTALDEAALLAQLPPLGCLPPEALFALAEGVTSAYVAAGYVTSRAYLPEQDLSSGRLEIGVLEGRVEAIELIENGRIRRPGRVLPVRVGQVLQIRQVEQGLDQINALASKDAKVSFRPGTKPGWSIVEVTIAARPGWQARASINNSGTHATGDLQRQLQLTMEDALGAFETLSYTRKRNLLDDGGHTASRSDALALSLPLGDWTLGWTLTATGYRSPVEGQGQVFQTSGDTLVSAFSVERLLHRDQVSKTSLRAELGLSEVHNYFEDALIGVSSRSLSVLSLELLHSHQVLGGTISTTLGLDRGLPIFGAADNAGPLGEFTKLHGDASFGIPLGFGFVLSTSIAGQWSPDALYSSEQISLGGASSVRGFDEESISSESGLTWRNELAYVLPSLGSDLDPLLGTVTAFAAIDAGWVFPGSALDTTVGLAGAALGLRASQGQFFGSASYEIPLAYPDHFSAQPAFRFEAGISLSQF